MTLILRKLESTDVWLKAKANEESGVGEALPAWGIREFVPSEKDGEGLSVFRVRDRTEALQVAAAFGMSKATSAEKGRYAFMAVEENLLSEAGINISKTPGDLGHLVVDDKHYEIRVRSSEDLLLVASTFWSGDLMHFEGRTVLKAMRDSMRRDDFDVAGQAKISPQKGVCMNALKFIADGAAVVRGVPEVVEPAAT